jgi:hypothetical protein
MNGNAHLDGNTRKYKTILTIISKRFTVWKRIPALVYYFLHLK